MKPIYSTKVSVEGGRNGTAQSDDGFLNLKLTLPKEFGGEGKPGTNPEQLFAAGYAACFESTLRFIAGQKKLPLTNAKIRAEVDVHADPSGGFLLASKLEIHLDGLTETQAQNLLTEAQKVCPYHKMAHGNIEQSYNLILN